MQLPSVVRKRVRVLLLLGPPLFAMVLAGMLVGVVRKLVREPEAPAPDFVVLGSIAGVALAALAAFLIGATRVRRCAHTYFPRLWRTVPWTTAGGFVAGLVAAGAHALTK